MLLAWLNDLLASMRPTGAPQQKFYNNLSATLQSNIAADTTVFAVVIRDGNWPGSLDAGQTFDLTFTTAQGAIEIMRVTHISGSTITVARGREGTTPQPWTVTATTITGRLTAFPLSAIVRTDEVGVFTQPMGFQNGLVAHDEVRIVDELAVGPAEAADLRIIARETGGDPNVTTIVTTGDLEVESPALSLNGIEWPTAPELVEGQRLAVENGRVVGKFDSYYLGAQDNFPTAMPDGSLLEVGAYFFHIDYRRAYYWTGTGWETGEVPSSAVTAGLTYRPVAPVSALTLLTPDLRGATYVLATTAPYEDVVVHLNGVLQARDVGDWSVGSYQVNPGTNSIAFHTPVAAGVTIQVDVLVPKEKLAYGQVAIEAILDLDTNWAAVGHPAGMINGSRTTFQMYWAPAGDPIEPANMTSNVEAAVFVNNDRLRPGVDYSIAVSYITFTAPPQPTDDVWVLWYRSTGGGVGGGSGIPPAPLAPQNAYANLWGWHPDDGEDWRDLRAISKSVATLAARNALVADVDTMAGAIVYVAADDTFYRFDNPGWTAVVRPLKQTSAGVTDAGRAVALNASGLIDDTMLKAVLLQFGGSAIQVTDWDQAHINGTSFLRGGGAAANSPVVAAVATGFYIREDATNGMLVAMIRASNRVFTRKRVGGVWGAWGEVATDDANSVGVRRSQNLADLLNIVDGRANLQVPYLAPTAYVGEMNALDESGIYKLGIGVTNGWTADGAASAASAGDHVMHMKWDAQSAYQIGFSWNGDNSTVRPLRVRTKASNVWGAWVSIMSATDVVNYVTGKIATTEEAIAGTDNTKLMTPARVADVIGARGAQVGDVIVTLGVQARAGAIKINGATLSRATYPELYTYAVASGRMAASEGAKGPGEFGPGDGATTFSIPDVRGYFPRIWDDGRGVDTGRTLGSYQADTVRNHVHTGTTSVAGDHSHYTDTCEAIGNIYGISESFGLHGGSTDGVFYKTSTGPSLNGTPQSVDASGTGTVRFYYAHAHNTNVTGAHTHTMTTSNPTANNEDENRVKNVNFCYWVVYE